MTLSKLTGAQFEKIQEALLSAYPAGGDLAIMVRTKLEENLDSITADNDDLRQVTYKLIRWAEANGKVKELIYAAQDGNPNNLELQKLFEEIDKFDLIEHTSSPNILSISKGEKGRVVDFASLFSSIVAAIIFAVVLLLNGLQDNKPSPTPAPTSTLSPTPHVPTPTPMSTSVSEKGEIEVVIITYGITTVSNSNTANKFGNQIEEYFEDYSGGFEFSPTRLYIEEPIPDERSGQELVDEQMRIQGFPDLLIVGTVLTNEDGINEFISSYDIATKYDRIVPELATDTFFTKPIKLASAASILDDMDKYLQKLSILNSLIEGLNYYIAGRFDDALSIFESYAETTIDTPDIIYLLAGRASVANGESRKAIKYYDISLDAEQYVNQSLIGFGNAWLQIAYDLRKYEKPISKHDINEGERCRDDPNSELQTLKLLAEKSLSCFELAFDSKHDNDNVIHIKSAFGLGEAYRLLTNNNAEALNYYSEVIQRFKELPKSTQALLYIEVAQAYAGYAEMLLGIEITEQSVADSKAHYMCAIEAIKKDERFDEEDGIIFYRKLHQIWQDEIDLMLDQWLAAHGSTTISEVRCHEKSKRRKNLEQAA